MKGVRAGAVGLLFLVAAISACRFERRPDPAGSPQNTVAYDSPGTPGSPLQDSVRAVVAALTDAFAAGDVAGASAWTTPDAVLLDLDDGVFWTVGSDDPLPTALEGPDGGTEWRIDRTSLTSLSGDAALLSRLFFAQRSADGDPRSAVETWIVVRAEGGWRARYLHRSREGPAAPPR